MPGFSGDATVLTPDGLMPLALLLGGGAASAGGCWVHTVRLANGCVVRATADAKLRTASAGYKEVQDLVVGQDRLELRLGCGLSWLGGTGTYAEGLAAAAAGFGVAGRTYQYVVAALRALCSSCATVDARSRCVRIRVPPPIVAGVQQALLAVGVDCCRADDLVTVRSPGGLHSFAHVIGFGHDDAGDARRARLDGLVAEMETEPDLEELDADADDGRGASVWSRVVSIDEGAFDPAAAVLQQADGRVVVNGFCVLTA